MSNWTGASGTFEGHFSPAPRELRGTVIGQGVNGLYQAREIKTGMIAAGLA